MSDVAIRVKSLGKRYRIGGRHVRHDTVRDLIASVARAPLRTLRSRTPSLGPEEFWALRDVSFSIKRGEVLGIIGNNGAGKSTLLKVLSRVTHPTTGSAEIRGRIGSLLEVGTGFHPELTGRENILLNGAILGMKQAEIRKRFDEIVAFSEIEQFLDTPVKRYSSGMYMRLAFSIAAHLEPDILAVDEVLAVGDAAFQKRCLGRMRGIARGAGRTVLFVSHNLQAVQMLCDRIILLGGGRVLLDGPPQTVIGRYLDSIEERSQQMLDENPDRGGDGRIRLTRVCIRDETGAERSDFVAGDPLTFDFEYVRSARCTGISLGFTVYNQLGIACTHFNTSAVDFSLAELRERGHLVCRIERTPFPVGSYHISIVMTVDGGVADFLPGARSFRIASSRFFPTTTASEPELLYCPVMVDHRWSRTEV